MNRPVVPFGDSAWLVEVETVDAALRLAKSVEEDLLHRMAPAGIGDIVVGFRSVVVHVDPLVEEPERCRAWLADLDPGSGDPPDDIPPPVRRIDIPVIFDGADLDEVATIAGVPAEIVVDKITGADLLVAFLGFSPGFPYLVGLPAELAAIRRRPRPRLSVPRGSIAVAGGFAGLYPQSTPGGWMLIGRTSLTLFDPDTPPYARLRPGDRVRFRNTGEIGSDPSYEHDVHGATAIRTPCRSGTFRFVEVIDPGLLSMVEDGGRSSVASLGVPRAGPADPDAMRLANRLVGNADADAVVEVTATGPTLCFTGDSRVAVVGSTGNAVGVTLDGHSVGGGAVVPIRSGQVLRVGRVHRGLRAYIGIGGGIQIPAVMGSRSSDVLSGVGLGPLMVGDRLDLGRPGPARGFLTHSPSDVVSPAVSTIRVVSGPHRCSQDELLRLLSIVWNIEGDSNRVGLLLSATTGLAPISPGGIGSAGMVTGAIQVPPDGRPIVLLPDHATVGGYPVIACVITADHAKLGQLRGEDRVRFEQVSRLAARAALLENERTLARRVAGWFPSESGV
ncbi:MAG: 5-oxoprolinase subunit B/C family protein [Acidimicrobiales bacterium]